MLSTFQFARLPKVAFGPGVAARLPNLLGGFRGPVLLVASGSAQRSPQWTALRGDLAAAGRTVFRFPVKGEPSPELVDAAVDEHRAHGIDVVVAWGGGSALDAGKAISAMLRQPGSVVDYLEGVGDPAAHSGAKVPFVAVPTTAGTGSEATKNAVLSRVGPGGFKRSLRHDNFVPDVAVIDPELALTCPPEVTAACGLDAFTQLLESFVSTAASPLTDAMAWSGLERIAASLLRASRHGDNLAARADMAYAAFLSGVTLANAGLGAVHGLAGVLGGLFPIPHGVACGALMGAVAATTIDRLRTAHGEDHPALRKYARVGALLAGRAELDVAAGCEALVEAVAAWLDELQMPRLSAFGIGEADLDRIVAGAENKNNPIALSAEDLRGILLARL
jgi:alcohol dehydrogenase class IV